jgi:hypothetical protein
MGKIQGTIAHRNFPKARILPVNSAAQLDVTGG